MTSETTVSIHPYFKPHEGKLDEFIGIMDTFVERTSSEEAVLFYDFTISGETVFCREAYVGSEGALAHLANVDDIIQAALEISDLIRLEIHGAAAELDKMREPLKELPVEWFELKKALVK
ncbi:hypothetical protein VSU19_01035 [Verrucomicrobiales bacterium BCK34]|nr:hypothetical protein [Verrucomicrobiales bacterium BCK34]